jgi:hypothetical protein
MPPDETLASRIRMALRRARRVEEKKMFGGIALWSTQKICISVEQGPHHVPHRPCNP